MNTNDNGEGFKRTELEQENIDSLLNEHMNLLPKLGNNWNKHSLVTLRRQSMSKILYLDWIYKKLLGKPGVICEFGVQWGASLTILNNLSAIYEPYNHQREIHGFDTFKGFSGVSLEDGDGHKKGDYSTSIGYKKQLSNILKNIVSSNPLNHIDKTFLIEGDVSKTINPWLEKNPALAIGLAIFDMDVISLHLMFLKQLNLVFLRDLF